MSAGTVSLSWGGYGGFYATRYCGCLRLCFGWVALTYLPEDLDDVLRWALDSEDST